MGGGRRRRGSCTVLQYSSVLFLLSRLSFDAAASSAQGRCEEANPQLSGVVVTERGVCNCCLFISYFFLLDSHQTFTRRQDRLFLVTRRGHKKLALVEAAQISSKQHKSRNCTNLVFARKKVLRKVFCTLMLFLHSRFLKKI